MSKKFQLPIMSKKFQHILSVLSILIFVYIGIGSAPSQKSITTESEQIPPAIKGYTGTILIVKSTKNWTKYADKNFSEHYTGKYIIVDEKDLATYADADQYRFVITRNESTGTDYGTKTTYYVEKICMLDRKNGTLYCTKKGTSNFGKLLEAYAQALENAR